LQKVNCFFLLMGYKQKPSKIEGGRYFAPVSQNFLTVRYNFSLIRDGFAAVRLCVGVVLCKQIGGRGCFAAVS